MVGLVIVSHSSKLAEGVDVPDDAVDDRTGVARAEKSAQRPGEPVLAVQ